MDMKITITWNSLKSLYTILTRVISRRLRILLYLLSFSFSVVVELPRKPHILYTVPVGVNSIYIVMLLF